MWFMTTGHGLILQRQRLSVVGEYIERLREMHDQCSCCSEAQTVWEYSTHFINQAVNGLLIPDQSHFIQLIESNSLEFMEMKPSPHVPDSRTSVCVCMCVQKITLRYNAFNAAYYLLYSAFYESRKKSIKQN